VQNKSNLQAFTVSPTSHHELLKLQVDKSILPMAAQ
jgi:hypothetical protein